MTDFNLLKKLYDDDKFVDLVGAQNGLYWLKLRSVSRAAQLREIADRANIEGYEEISARGSQLLKYVYDNHPDENLIDLYIKELFEGQRSIRRREEDQLVAELYQMRVFYWGGLYQNSLEQTIVNNYVKKIKNWNELNNAIDNELHTSLQGYVRNSWYNHWTSILIEDIFNDHPKVTPAVGKIKKVDFFLDGMPFDLKVTYFPDGYMNDLRKRDDLSREIIEMKAFCRANDIWYDRELSESDLFPILLARLSEYTSREAQNFVADLRQRREEYIQETLQNPQDLIVWLYENQGVRRFDASNRFFLILIDQQNLEESWKLKRNKEILVDSIHNYLDNFTNNALEDLRISFRWQNATYHTYADALFIIR